MDDGERPIRVMPWWFVLGGLVFAILVGLAVIWWLLGIAEAGTPSATLRIDAIRTGLTVVAGTGGAVGLVLVARRQWLSERTQRHRERVDALAQAHQERVQAHAEATAHAVERDRDRQAELTEYDATERRVTELFSTAVEHLGSDKAPVRLGGVYALERLAHNNVQYRQTIVDVITAYLRMPADGENPDEDHVRLAAQRVLTRRLRPGDGHWDGMRVDLAGARLAEFDAVGCVFAEADFGGAIFVGVSMFEDAEFLGPALFSGAVFEDDVLLRRTRWRGTGDFNDVKWAG